jgi:hypothetical protein
MEKASHLSALRWQQQIVCGGIVSTASAQRCILKKCPK